MDLALAYALNAKLEAAGKRLDSWQFLALVHAASKAKIVLFNDGGLAQAPIAVPSRGSSRCLPRPQLSRRLSIARCWSKLLSTVFSPEPALTTSRARAVWQRLQEFGLPYASDPVVSKHIARFLAQGACRT